MQQYELSIPDEIRDNPRRLKSFNRKKLKQLQEKPYVNGHNTIRILRVADKYVKLSEHVFGVYQEHQRYNINNAFNYISYRIQQIERYANLNTEEIDVSKQSMQYRIQHENLQVVIDDLKDLIHETLSSLYNRKGFFDTSPYSLLFNDEEKTLMIAFNNSLNVVIRKEIEFDCFILSYNINLDTIQTSRDAQLLNVINTIASLTHSTSTKAMNFNLLFSKYFMFVENLRKLYSTPIDEKTSKLEDELQEFIKKSKLNQVHTYTYKLNSINGFNRTFLVEKITRVRTLIEIKAINDETGEEFIEYRKTINKIFHQIQNNAKEIAVLIKQHN